MNNSRAIAASIITKVIKNQCSLDHLLDELKEHKDTSFIKELCFGTLRWYHQLNKIAELLLNKPLPAKYFDIHCLLLVGLYQLIYLKTPPHAAVSETVNATLELQKAWAKALINKTLRLFIDDEERFLNKAKTSEEGLYSHPQWLIGKLKKAWPENYQAILEQNNQRAPLSLRVNQQKTTRAKYLELLSAQNITALAVEPAPEAIKLETAVPVNKLPGFAEGFCSVQDLSGQLAALILKPQASERILDACAAPGSKTTHLLEAQPLLEKLIAIDISAERLKKLEENIQRLGLKASPIELITANASHPEAWWDGKPFDAILLDAPCSGTGVIRRHPDIKVLRHPDDVKEQVALQAELLEALWPLLKVGGRLLYSTCSILPEENEKQIHQFLLTHPDAKSISLNLGLGVTQHHGLQILTGDCEADGFYYALIAKN